MDHVFILSKKMMKRQSK